MLLLISLTFMFNCYMPLTVADMERIQQVAVCAVVDAHVALAVHADQQQVKAVEHHSSQRISPCLDRIHLHQTARQRRVTGAVTCHTLHAWHLPSTQQITVACIASTSHALNRTVE
jgi:hypothetical protein